MHPGLLFGPGGRLPGASGDGWQPAHQRPHALPDHQNLGDVRRYWVVEVVGEHDWVGPIRRRGLRRPCRSVFVVVVGGMMGLLQRGCMLRVSLWKREQDGVEVPGRP